MSCETKFVRNLLKILTYNLFCFDRTEILQEIAETRSQRSRYFTLIVITGIDDKFIDNSVQSCYLYLCFGKTFLW